MVAEFSTTQAQVTHRIILLILSTHRRYSAGKRQNSISEKIHVKARTCMKQEHKNLSTHSPETGENIPFHSFAFYIQLPERIESARMLAKHS